LEPCPFDGCDSRLKTRSATCPSCNHTLLWCVHCGTANRPWARYCRGCAKEFTRTSQRRQEEVLSPLGAVVKKDPAAVIGMPGQLLSQFHFAYGHLFFGVLGTHGPNIQVYQEADLHRVAQVGSELQQLWHVVVTRDRLVTVGEGGVEEFALDPLLLRGQRVAERPVLGRVLPGATPVAVHPDRYFVATDQEIHGLPLLGKGRPWRRSRRSDKGGAMLAVVQDLLVVMEESGEISALDLETGREVWAVRSRFAYATAVGCATASDRIFALTADGHLSVLHVNNRLTHAGPAVPGHVHGVACNDRYVYTAGSAGLHRFTGVDPWYTPVISRALYAAPLVTEEAVFAGCSPEGLLFAEPTAEHGRYLAAEGDRSARAAQVRTSPVLAGHRIYVGAQDGTVTRYTYHARGDAH
jgi:hypothetical protein